MCVEKLPPQLFTVAGIVEHTGSLCHDSFKGWPKLHRRKLQGKNGEILDHKLLLSGIAKYNTILLLRSTTGINQLKVFIFKCKGYTSYPIGPLSQATTYVIGGVAKVMKGET